HPPWPRERYPEPGNLARRPTARRRQSRWHRDHLGTTHGAEPGDPARPPGQRLGSGLQPRRAPPRHGRGRQVGPPLGPGQTARRSGVRMFFLRATCCPEAICAPGASPRRARCKDRHAAGQYTPGFGDPEPDGSRGNTMRRGPMLVVASFTLLAALGGCQREKPQVAPAEASAVPGSQPAHRDVTDYVDFTGRTDAVQPADIRARVTGYLVKMPFKEGSEVKAGDLLFEIDPRPYQAQLDQATSQVALYEASLKLARSTLERDRAIVGSGGVSQQQIDQDQAAVGEAQAGGKADQAGTQGYK